METILAPAAFLIGTLTGATLTYALHSRRRDPDPVEAILPWMDDDTAVDVEAQAELYGDTRVRTLARLATLGAHVTRAHVRQETLLRANVPPRHAHRSFRGLLLKDDRGLPVATILGHFPGIRIPASGPIQGLDCVHCEENEEHVHERPQGAA